MSEVVQRFKDEDWVTLINKIKRRSCSPFLGPGVVSRGFEQRAQIAREFAQRFEYPMEDDTNLARVGRFVSVKYDGDTARSLLVEEYSKLPKPDISDPNDPHAVLASLPIPIYLTTNHDDFMMQALKAADKDPQIELCKWKPVIIDESKFLSKGEEPTAARPVVFHLYGYPQPVDRNMMLDSLVFTEDDYFEFLISISSDDETIPNRVRRAMTGTSLLLLGYRIEEIDFRVLFHYLLAKSLQLSTSRTYVVVQVDDARPEEQRKKVQEFLDRYITSKRLDVRVYWGSSQQFAAELKERWDG